MENLSRMKFPLSSNDYELYEEVGEGVSATVYRALCIPLKHIVAIKVLDLEKCNNYLDGVAREVQTMKLIDHPNVLRAHCSFTTGSSLWIVMPYMDGGSCLHIMKFAHSEGFEELVITKVLYEVLKALAYLHAHGHIHRDVKAGNILVDSKGTVKLADFGVSASMFEPGDRQRLRNTFVGTPCWMAPEVMQQLHGYNCKADIWSFGITALELAHGHAPFSKYPPMKVMLLTLQNAPPRLDYERDKKFSKAFKDMVAACLVKDPKKRPTSKKLLKHCFFKNACSNKFLAQSIFYGLHPLGDRFKMLKEKEAEFLLQNKDLYGGKEQLSQQEYIRGISAWDFDPVEFKKQAALIQDCDDISDAQYPELKCKRNCDFDNFGSPAISPVHPFQALQSQIDIPVDDANASTPNCHMNNEETLSSLLSMANTESETFAGDFWEQRFPLAQDVRSETSVSSNGTVILKNYISPSRKASDDHASDQLLHYRITENGRFLYVDEPGFQREEHYNVRQDDSSSEDVPNGFINPLSDQSVDSSAGVFISKYSKYPMLRCLLQQNIMQREQIKRLIRYVNQSTEFEVAANTEPQSSLVTAWEGYLQSQVTHMQRRVGRLVEELQKQKLKNAQLERQLSASLKTE